MSGTESSASEAGPSMPPKASAATSEESATFEEGASSSAGASLPPDERECVRQKERE